MIVAIVGGGNSAHVLVNVLTRANIRTILISRRPSEWNSNGVTMSYGSGEKRDTYNGVEFTVSNDYKLTREADVICLCCPVSAQIDILKKLKPFLQPKTFIGTIFGQARFDEMVAYIIDDEQPCFAFIQIPWTCRTTKYGMSVDNLGDQDVDLAFRKKDLDSLLFKQLDTSWLNCIHTDPSKCIRQVTFTREWFFPSNIIIHPGICYGRYLTKSSNPYFYRALSPISGASIDELDIERLKVVNALNDRYHLDINNISIVDQWTNVWKNGGRNMQQCIGNDETLQNVIAGADIQYNAKHRFFGDDIPYGLCYMKYVALSLNIDTPFMDCVICWAQKVMGTRYLDNNGKLVKQNLPQYYAHKIKLSVSKL